MGEMAEMALDGTLCQVCGQLLLGEDESPPGYPQTCGGCRAEGEGDDYDEEYAPDRLELGEVVIRDGRLECPICHRLDCLGDLCCVESTMPAAEGRTWESLGVTVVHECGGETTMPPLKVLPVTAGNGRVKQDLRLTFVPCCLIQGERTLELVVAPGPTLRWYEV